MQFSKEAEQITDVGSLFPPDYERIASLNPTLILMSDGNVSVRDHLQHLGFRVLVIHPKSVADVVDSILSRLDALWAGRLRRNVYLPISKND